MKRTQWLIVCAILLIAEEFCGHAQGIALHDGDRVAFYGDSITAQRLYTRFVEDFVLTRYPQLHVTFFNAGVPGDTVNGGYTGDRATRLRRDLFPHRPTVVTIMLGMNDGYYMPFDPKYLKIFEDGYRDLLKETETRDPGVRFTLITTTPYDEVTHGTEFARYNESVSRNAEFVKEIASSSHFPLSDFDLAISNLLQTAKRGNPSLAPLLVPDRIHPSEASHWVMAAELARTWGFSPVVSSVSLDAVHAKTESSSNTEISDLAAKDGGLQWTQADKALPLPLPLHDATLQFVLSISSLAAMDQQMLRVGGLKAARYSLKIDGRPIASFTSEQLATGVNLALYPTPMQSQAREVDGIELKRTRLDETNFIVAIEDPKVAGAADATKVLETKGAVLEEQQHKADQPHPHKFALVPE